MLYVRKGGEQLQKLDSKLKTNTKLSIYDRYLKKYIPTRKKVINDGVKRMRMKISKPISRNAFKQLYGSEANSNESRISNKRHSSRYIEKYYSAPLQI